MQQTDTNNHVELRGNIAQEFSLSHITFGERFLRTMIRIPRLSNSVDLLPVTISESLLCSYVPAVGSPVSIAGQLRSYNQQSAGGNRLVLSVFAKDIVFVQDQPREYHNTVLLRGHLCKAPVYRVTPLNREIADLLLAVNRAYGKSDYIPCIAWGRAARRAKDLEIGQQVLLSGRMQSREYQKVLSDQTVETRVAYEVSLSKLQPLHPQDALPNK